MKERIQKIGLFFSVFVLVFSLASLSFSRSEGKRFMRS